MGDLFETGVGLEGFDSFRDINEEAAASGDVEGLLSAFQAHLSLHGDDVFREFLGTAESKIAESCAFVTDETDLSHHELFLRKLVRRAGSSVQNAGLHDELRYGVRDSGQPISYPGD